MTEDDAKEKSSLLLMTILAIASVPGMLILFWVLMVVENVIFGTSFLEDYCTESGLADVYLWIYSMIAKAFF